MLTLVPGLTHYKDVDAPTEGRIISPNIWAQIVRGAMTPDGHNAARLIYDDFDCLVAGEAVSSNVATYITGSGGWTSYEDTGGAIAQIATDNNGVITLTTDTTDNDENWLGRGSATSVCAMVSDTAADARFLAFEARFKVSAVASNCFVGLGEEGLAAADSITDAGALADKDWIGFYALEADGDALKFGYKKSGQTIQNVATVHTLVADTYVNVGFVYDPDETADKKIKVYVNNAEKTAARVTATNIAAATFPDGEELNVYFGHKNSTTSANVMSVDGFGLYQAR